MRSLRLLPIVCLVAALLAVGTPASSQSGTDLVQACLDNGGSASMCKGLHQTLRIPGGACRDIAANDPACAVFDGIEISEALVAAQESSWLNEALAHQRSLDDDHPLQDELWTHTHNSFNADAYPLQVLGGLDRNHIYSVGDQLRMGVRAIELDLHYNLHLTTAAPRAVQVCHGTEVPLPDGSNYHLGCELNSPLLGAYLTEISAWMDDNPDEVLMLYLENALDENAQAHEQAAASLVDAFGDLIYAPPTTDCTPIPMDVTRKQIRDSGARILITGNCGPANSPWNALVHERGSRWKEGGLDYGDDFPAYPCTERRADQDYANNWIRHWGDETGLSAGAGSGGDVTPNDALNMVRCGVNMVGWDNLVPFDERMGNMVWSWRMNEPSTDADGYCARLADDDRFDAADCGGAGQTVMRFACYDGTNWRVTRKSGRWSAGKATCRAERLGAFSVPWNGYEMERLKEATPDSAAGLWLNYHASGGRWVSL
jgi:hypothetical protein